MLLALSSQGTSQRELSHLNNTQLLSEGGHARFWSSQGIFGMNDWSHSKELSGLQPSGLNKGGQGMYEGRGCMKAGDVFLAASALPRERYLGLQRTSTHF